MCQHGPVRRAPCLLLILLLPSLLAGCGAAITGAGERPPGRARSGEGSRLGGERRPTADPARLQSARLPGHPRRLERPALRHERHADLVLDHRPERRPAPDLRPDGLPHRLSRRARAAERPGCAPRAAGSDDVLARSPRNARATRDLERDGLCGRGASGRVLDPLRVRGLRAEREAAGALSATRVRPISSSGSPTMRTGCADSGRPWGRADYGRTRAAKAGSPASRVKSASTATAARRSGSSASACVTWARASSVPAVEALVAGEVVEDRRIVREALFRRGEDRDSGGVPARGVVGVGAAERVPAQMDARAAAPALRSAPRDRRREGRRCGRCPRAISAAAPGRSTTTAADCWPRVSPPAACPACERGDEPLRERARGRDDRPAPSRARRPRRRGCCPAPRTPRPVR